VRDRGALVTVAVCFVASRLLLIALGVHFDISLMPWYWQVLDLDLLRHHLAQSVWNLHSQPPGFNLLIGAVLKIAPGHAAGAFHLVFVALGLGAALALVPLLRSLGFSARIATAGAVLISCSPFWLVYENWLYYDFIVMTLLILAGAALARFAQEWRAGWGVTFFGLLALVIFTRASFQIVWLIAVLLVLLAVANARARRAILVSMAVPLLLVLSLYAKNVVMFGVPSTTSWFGMNLARITLWIAPDEQLRSLVRDGKLSRVALVDPFSPLADYHGEIELRRRTGVPALDRPMKRNGGINLNDATYIDLSRVYLRQSLLYIRYEPKGYARGVAKAVGKLSVPATDYSYVYPERDKIRLWDRVFNSLVYWRTPWSHGVGFGLLLMYLVCIVGGARQAYRSLRGRVAVSPVTLFLWMTVTYLILLAGLTDFGENQRVHLPIDPLVLILTAFLVRDPLRRAYARAQGVRRRP
jgi:hypothetical protein